MRVASGQKIPELDVNMEEDGGEAGSSKGGMLSPNSEAGESDAGNTANVASPTDAPDVADRAAAMLEGLTGGSGGGDSSLNVRRRRESADNERERRRRRRQQASSTKTEDGALTSPPPIREEGEGEEEDAIRTSVISRDGTDSGNAGLGTPVTIVSPPSPEQKRAERELPTPPPEA